MQVFSSQASGLRVGEGNQFVVAKKEGRHGDSARDVSQFFTLDKHGSSKAVVIFSSEGNHYKIIFTTSYNLLTHGETEVVASFCLVKCLLIIMYYTIMI